LRWKLLLIVSLAAALGGAGGSYGLVYALLHFRRPLSSTLTFLIVGEFMPVVLSISASIFVYRHTARRRKLQAFINLLLSLILSQALLRLITLFVPLFIKAHG
jgi:hypothetical protein